ncbi:hypothetical protein EV714DRAFT_277944 [Schizophyllum commune]
MLPSFPSSAVESSTIVDESMKANDELHNASPPDSAQLGARPPLSLSRDTPVPAAIFVSSPLEPLQAQQDELDNDNDNDNYSEGLTSGPAPRHPPVTSLTRLGAGPTNAEQDSLSGDRASSGSRIHESRTSPFYFVRQRKLNKLSTHVVVFASEGSAPIQYPPAYNETPRGDQIVMYVHKVADGAVQMWILETVWNVVKEGEWRKFGRYKEVFYLHLDKDRLPHWIRSSSQERVKRGR